METWTASDKVESIKTLLGHLEGLRKYTLAELERALEPSAGHSAPISFRSSLCECVFVVEF